MVCWESFGWANQLDENEERMEMGLRKDGGMSMASG